MITYHGTVDVPQEVIDAADRIKLDNYKVNKPTSLGFKVRRLHDLKMVDQLAKIAKVTKSLLDIVYFSCCKGAEPHVDKLKPEKYEDTTYVIPVILPKGKSVIYAEGASMDVGLGGVYQFDHTRVHSMSLEDTDSGCVVVMVAVLKEQETWNQHMIG